MPPYVFCDSRGGTLNLVHVRQSCSALCIGRCYLYVVLLCVHDLEMHPAILRGCSLLGSWGSFLEVLRRLDCVRLEIETGPLACKSL